MRKLPPGWIEEFLWHDLAMKMNVSLGHEIVGAPYADPDGFIDVESLRSSRCVRNITAYDVADLSEPVLVATIGGVRVLVDGRHRVKRALVDKVSVLPCYILTERETARCFEGKQQQQRYKKLRDFLRKVEIQVRIVAQRSNGTPRRGRNIGHHPPTVRRPQ